MGFDLKPKKKDAGWFHMGALSWSWMLMEGVGLVIGTGPGKDPATFSYIPDAKGRCPNYNDGFEVSNAQAKMMAVAARGLVSVCRAVTAKWDEIPEPQRGETLKRNESLKLYKNPVRSDFIDKDEAFAEWAEKSGGFSVN